MIRLFGHLYAPEDRGTCVVTVHDGRVAAIEGASTAPAGSLGWPDARILPGLLDIQVNGGYGEDFSNPGADVAAVCRKLPQTGVTGFLPTIITSPADAYAPALANLRGRAVPGGARVLGAHVEGSFLSPQRPGTHDRALLRLPSVWEVDGWLEAGDVRLVTLAPELPGALEVIGHLVDRGIVVSMGHSDATWEEARAGAEAGARLGTHLFNAMRPLGHRDLGVVGYLLASHLPVSVIGDGVHLAPETITLVARIKAPDELVLITDALSGLGMPPGRYVLSGIEFTTDGVCGRLPDGTLSGSLLPLNRALRNLVSFGVDPAAAVRAATLNPARVLGIDGRHGRVEVGRAADLVLVDRDWEVLATLVDGLLVAGTLAVSDPASVTPERGP